MGKNKNKENNHINQPVTVAVNFQLQCTRMKYKKRTSKTEKLHFYRCKSKLRFGNEIKNRRKNEMGGEYRNSKKKILTMLFHRIVVQYKIKIWRKA